MRPITLYIIAISALIIGIATASSAFADSFEYRDQYRKRRVPAAQYGVPDNQEYYRRPTIQRRKSADEPASCCRGTPPRWYAGLSGSIVFLNDEDIQLSSPAPLSRYSDSYETNVGVGFAGQIGYYLTPTIRAELELLMQTSELDSLNGGTPSLPNGTISEQRTLAMMFNGYYDFRNDSNYVPYLGAGIGTAHIKAPVFYPGNSTFLKERVLAYQFLAGIGYETELYDAPVVISVGYRYFTTPDIDTKFNTGGPITATWHNTSHNIVLGGRVKF